MLDTADHLLDLVAMSQTTVSRPALRVALADDAALFRQGLALLLGEAGFTVTARVGDAQALLAAVHTDPPDAVVVDIRMPPTYTTEGLDAARALSETHPGIGVLVLSAHVEPGYALDRCDEREHSAIG